MELPASQGTGAIPLPELRRAASRPRIDNGPPELQPHDKYLKPCQSSRNYRVHALIGRETSTGPCRRVTTVFRDRDELHRRYQGSVQDALSKRAGDVVCTPTRSVDMGEPRDHELRGCTVRGVFWPHRTGALPEMPGREAEECFPPPCDGP